MTRDEALEILASGQFEPFVGAAESLEVEFKGAPYNLNGDPDRQKFEFVKDVSALANASGGGVIVIGAATTRDAETRVDVVHEVNPLARALVNTEQYEHLIAERIYPSLTEVEAVTA